MRTSEHQLTGGLADVAAARALVRRVLAGRDAALVDAAVLLTDEVVANAVAHGGGTFSMWCQMVDGSLRVAVADESRAAPMVLRSGPQHEHGRGMSIVDALANSWGVAVQAGGKVVWFELALDAAAGAAERDTRGRPTRAGTHRFEARPGRAGARVPAAG